MKEICQVLICGDDNKKNGVIIGLEKFLFLSFDPTMILTDIYENNRNITVWDYKQTTKYNLQKFLHFKKKDKEQFIALTDGIKYLIDQSHLTASSISPSSLELLRPYYDITLKFTPIAKVTNILEGTSSYPPINYDTFTIDKFLGDRTSLFFDYFYQCYNPSDIFYAILHFLSINNYKFNKCKHCGKYFATNNLKIEYCKSKSGYPNYEKYECSEAVKRIRQQIRRQSELIGKNLRTNYLGDDLEKFITGRDILLDELIKHSDYTTIDKCFDYFDKNKWYIKNSFRNVGKKK